MKRLSAIALVVVLAWPAFGITIFLQPGIFAASVAVSALT